MTVRPWENRSGPGGGAPGGRALIRSDQLEHVGAVEPHAGGGYPRIEVRWWGDHGRSGPLWSSLMRQSPVIGLWYHEYFPFMGESCPQRDGPAPVRQAFRQGTIGPTGSWRLWSLKTSVRWSPSQGSTANPDSEQEWRVIAFME